MTRTDRLTRDDYQAAMASLDWQDRRRIELASHRGGLLDDPTHAALAADRGRRSSLPMYSALAVIGPLAVWLIWSWMQVGGAARLWIGAFWALVFAFLLARVVVYRRARAQHLLNADFEGLRAIAHEHRVTYRRRD